MGLSFSRRCRGEAADRRSSCTDWSVRRRWRNAVNTRHARYWQRVHHSHPHPRRCYDTVAATEATRPCLGVDGPRGGVDDRAAGKSRPRPTLIWPLHSITGRQTASRRIHALELCCRQQWPECYASIRCQFLRAERFGSKFTFPGTFAVWLYTSRVNTSTTIASKKVK